MTAHLVTRGTGHEQQRGGGYLTKDERYERTRESAEGVNLAGSRSTTRAGLQVRDFVSDVFPVQQPRPRLS